MPRPEDTTALKELAQLGALHGLVEVSGQQLAKVLGTSQQTASRRLLELEKSGYVRREMGVRRQLIRLTDEGVNVLAREYASYKRLFDHRDRLVLSGRIASGLGEGKYYLSQPGYTDQFQAKFGFLPFPGTLNVDLEGSEVNKLRILQATPTVAIEGFNAADRTFGAVDAWQAELKTLRCALILPRRTHHTKTVEIVSPDYLRELLSLKDGDEVDVQVHLK